MNAWSRIVTLTAFAGLAPFIAALIFALAPGLAPLDVTIIERALIGYGAIILGFLGGVRWGIRLQGGAGSDLTFVIGILGSGLGLFTLLLPYPFALALLAIGFALQGAWDVVAGRTGAIPHFYAQIRHLLTWLVCLVLILILVVKTLF